MAFPRLNPSALISLAFAAIDSLAAAAPVRGVVEFVWLDDLFGLDEGLLEEHVGRALCRRDSLAIAFLPTLTHFKSSWKEKVSHSCEVWV